MFSCDDVSALWESESSDCACVASLNCKEVMRCFALTMAFLYTFNFVKSF